MDVTPFSYCNCDDKCSTKTFTLLCSDDLRKHYNMGQYWLEVDLDDLRNYDDQLADHLIKHPSEYLPLVIFTLFGIYSIRS